MHRSVHCTTSGALRGGLGLQWHLGVYFCQFHPKGSQKLGVETFLPFPRRLAHKAAGYKVHNDRQTGVDNSDTAPLEATQHS